MWRERNRFDLAAQSLRKILESQPDNAEALFQLGSIELQNQNFDQVRTTVSRLKQIDPNDPRAAELERAMAVGQTDDAALAEARRLAAGGAYDRAIAAYQRAFRGGPPPFDLAVEYYETLAGTGAGWEEARLRLKALAERSFATSRVKFAYARVLTYNEQTRREGIVMLADLAGDPAVGQAAFEAMRQAMLWLSIGPQDRPFFLDVQGVDGAQIVFPVIEELQQGLLGALGHRTFKLGGQSFEPVGDIGIQGQHQLGHGPRTLSREVGKGSCLFAAF